MEFPHSANSITDFKISITTASSRTQTFSTLSAPEDTILSREPNFQNQDFPGPFQKPEGETPSGSFQGPSSAPSEDSFTCPGYGPPGDSCPRPGGKFVLPRGRVVRVFTQTNPNFWLAIRDGSVVLAYMNPSDKFQQWVMNETYSTVKDEDGRPSFSLVNKATSQALKHGLGETQPGKKTNDWCSSWSQLLHLYGHGSYPWCSDRGFRCWGLRLLPYSSG